MQKKKKGISLNIKSVVCAGDRLILKRISRPTLVEVNKLFAAGKKFAKQIGLKKADVKKAVRKVRGGQ